MPDSYIQNLPTEILRQIVSQSTSASSLGLMLTCQALHSRVEPLIYEHIEWNIERTYSKATVHHFLQKLLDRPEVGLWVRKFTMVGRFDQKLYSGLSRTDIEQLLQRASQCHPDVFEDYNSKEWWHLIYSNSPIMLVALLIFNCPNIQHLTPWTGYTEPEPRLLFLRRAISTLPNLKGVDYGTGYTKFPTISWKSSDINELMRMPKLRKMRLQLTEPWPPTGRWETWQAPNITNFELHSSVLREESIGNIISRLPNLTSLRLSLLRETKPNSNDSSHAGSFLDCDKLGAALIPPLARNLEYLAISTEFYASRDGHKALGGSYEDGREGNPGQLRYWGTKSSLNGLKAFEQLKTLEVDPVLLLGWHVDRASPLSQLLPSSLRHLRLRCDFIYCRHFKGRLPHLKSIFKDYVQGGMSVRLESLELIMLESDFLRYEESRKELEKICEDVGINFGIERLVG